MGGLIDAASTNGFSAQQGHGIGAGGEGPLTAGQSRPEKGEAGAIVVKIEIPPGQRHGAGGGSSGDKVEEDTVQPVRNAQRRGCQIHVDHGSSNRHGSS